MFRRRKDAGTVQYTVYRGAKGTDGYRPAARVRLSPRRPSRLRKLAAALLTPFTLGVDGAMVALGSLGQSGEAFSVTD